MPRYLGRLEAWQCAACGWVQRLHAGVEPPNRQCGNTFAGCYGRQKPMVRRREMDLPAVEGSACG